MSVDDAIGWMATIAEAQIGGKVRLKLKIRLTTQRLTVSSSHDTNVLE
jgi:hypothetical protein